jgi:signal transduction histidine kinase
MKFRTSFPSRFQQLRWKLMLSYTGVTVGVVLIVGLVSLAAAYFWLSNQINNGLLISNLVDAAAVEFAFDLRPLLSQNPPDKDNLKNWLNHIENQPVPMLLEGNIPMTIDAGELQVMVLDRQGLLLGSTSAPLIPDSQTGESLDTNVFPQLNSTLHAALRGEEELRAGDDLLIFDETIVVVVPIWNLVNDEVLGVLVISAIMPTVSSLIGDTQSSLPLVLILLTLVAGLIGTLFGFIAGRGLTRRLNRLSIASLAWSQGDFKIFVDDRSGDELGQLAQRLNQMAQKLNSLLDTRRELVVIEERNRLARDLHDSVKQHAFAASAQISTAKKLLEQDPAKAAEHIQEAEHLTDTLREELTSLIQELRPPALEGKGLAAALRDYSQDWSRQNEIELDLRLQGERPLPLNIEQAVFRIMQEALSNVARHSQAKKVEIGLVYTDNELTCTINDDGEGFDRDEVSMGFGIRSMQERIKTLGSKINLESNKGEGTLITFTLKFNNISQTEENPNHE